MKKYYISFPFFNNLMEKSIVVNIFLLNLISYFLITHKIDWLYILFTIIFILFFANLISTTILINKMLNLEKSHLKSRNKEQTVITIKINKQNIIVIDKENKINSSVEIAFRATHLFIFKAIEHSLLEKEEIQFSIKASKKDNYYFISKMNFLKNLWLASRDSEDKRKELKQIEVVTKKALKNNSTENGRIKTMLKRTPSFNIHISNFATILLLVSSLLSLLSIEDKSIFTTFGITFILLSIKMFSKKDGFINELEYSTTRLSLNLFIFSELLFLAVSFIKKDELTIWTTILHLIVIVIIRIVFYLYKDFSLFMLISKVNEEIEEELAIKGITLSDNSDFNSELYYELLKSYIEYREINKYIR